MTKMLSASGRLRPPDPLTRGSVPGPRWGLCPQTLIIGSCSALAMVPPTLDRFSRLWVGPSWGSCLHCCRSTKDRGALVFNFMSDCERSSILNRRHCQTASFRGGGTIETPRRVPHRNVAWWGTWGTLQGSATIQHRTIQPRTLKVIMVRSN